MLNHGIIVKKIGMTRMVDQKGVMTAVTLLQVGSQKVTKVLTPERDGYHGIQIGYWPKREAKLTKPDVARLRKVGVEESYTRFKEFRLPDADTAPSIGAEIGTSMVEGTTSVDITGISKGKGFQGAIKRWGNRSGRATHGSHFHNRPGSLGSNTTPGRVIKGKKIPGQTGNKQKTIQNLEVLIVDDSEGIIAVRGSVPGHRNGYLVLRPSIKAK
jgi:large subunit ribosomal protein L3